MKLLQKLILGIVFSLSIFSVAIPVKASTTINVTLYTILPMMTHQMILKS